MQQITYERKSSDSMVSGQPVQNEQDQTWVKTDFQKNISKIAKKCIKICPKNPYSADSIKQTLTFHVIIIFLNVQYRGSPTR